MALAIGTKLGSHEITALLGKGGMGEVYRARDLKLKREVAIKILPEEFSRDGDRVSRFRREAKVLASLNHPNIAAIYDLEETNEARYLVLELVEGEILAERIARGAIPVEEALSIAKSICEALEAAHEKGVMHRDLKPANIKITPDGKVKVLDFGLAKATGMEPNGTALSDSPTMLTTTLNPRAIIGTAGYMAPEQAKGGAVDRRADIWAFGVVLFEMLSRGRPFNGETAHEMVAAAMMKEPDWPALPASAPAALRRLLRRCLQKDPKLRLQAIADARIEIDETISGVVEEGPPAPEAPARRSGVEWPIASAALAAALIAVLLLWAPWRTPAPPPSALTRLSAEAGVDASIPALNTTAALTLSADGSMLAFTAIKGGTPQLYLRRLGQLQSTPVDGTAGARDPFFSPDGQWIAFFADGKLKKIPVSGSAAAIEICDAGSDRGGTWTADHAIVFQAAGSGPLSRVPDSGGKPVPLTTLAEGEFTERWPQMLPGGKAVLYTAHNRATGFENANVVVRPLPNGSPKIIQRGGYFGRYLASGHLVYIHANTLFAAPFDAARMELTGPPVQVLQNVAANALNTTPGAAAFAASETGTAVYLPSQEAFPAAPIEWLDHAGKVAPLRAVPMIWYGPRFSPDGREIAYTIRGGRQQDLMQDVWVYEWARDTLTRLTSDGSHFPVWSPDGRRIVFRSNPDGGGAVNLYWKRADGSSAAQRLTESKNAQFPGSWHPGGKFFAFSEINPQTGYDIMISPVEGDETSGWKPGKPVPFVSTPATETAPKFSPDGRWIAYQSNESGRNEIYVRPFPASSGKWQVSTEGGTDPVWSRAHHELFFATPDGHLMNASYTADGDSFHPEKPRPWSDKRIAPGPGFDLHPDGERFAAAVAPDTSLDAKQDKIVFIFNFFDELRRVAPISKR